MQPEAQDGTRQHPVMDARREDGAAYTRNTRNTHQLGLRDDVVRHAVEDVTNGAFPSMHRHLGPQDVVKLGVKHTAQGVRLLQQVDNMCERAVRVW